MNTFASGGIPNSLYKYRSAEQAIEILKNSTMWFAKAESFNDPFDCDLSETLSYRIEDFNTYCAYLNTQCKEAPIGPAEYVSLCEKFHIEPRKFRQLFIDARRKAINNRGILSLSKSKNSILMWSHYANNHKGVALGFDVQNDLVFFASRHAVKYEKNYDELNYLQNSQHSIIRNLTTKAKEWEYEEEVRIIKDEPTAHRFQSRCLQEINFGCNMPREEQQLVIDFCNNNDLEHIKFFKSEKSHGKFSLTFQPINPK